MDPLLSQAAEELFARACPGDVARSIRRGGPAGELWEQVEASGFLDALVPEAQGGAGLTPFDILPLLLATGRFAVPVPAGETIFARAAFALAGQTAPAGPIGLGWPVASPAEAAMGQGGARGPVVARTTGARQSRWVLVPTASSATVLPMTGATAADPSPDPGDAFGSIWRWDDAAGAARLEGTGFDWLLVGAYLEVTRMAGAMVRILEDTVRYAGERVQFGRPIGAFQAIQQQISVLTEEVHASRMATQLASVPASAGVGGAPAGLDPARVAAAKVRVGEAAARATAIAHAVHGAMGITEEVDLHLFTGLLHRGRLAFGSEGYWAGWLGRDFLEESAAVGSFDFVQERLAPAATA